MSHQSDCPQQELETFPGKVSNSCCKDYFQAAKVGHLQCLKDIHQNSFYGYQNSFYGYKWSCEVAATNGHLDCLKYLHQNSPAYSETIEHGIPFPWDRWTTYFAAKYGHLDCLKYAHQNGCARL